MSKIIDEEKVLKCIKNHIKETESKYVISVLSNLIECIKDIPSIQQSTGQWEYYNNLKYNIKPEDAYCSKCGFHINIMKVDNFDDYYYCPKCGCKMEKI